MVDTVIPITAQDPYRRDTNGDLSRGRGNQESKVAWEIKLRHLAECQIEVLETIKRHQPISGKEIAARLGKEFHKVSGRVTELVEAGFVEKTNLVRDGSRCLRIAAAIPEMRTI